MTNIGQFTARTLRDAMHIAAQLDDRARMTLDAAGMHIRARTPCDTTMAWIDIPATVIENYCPEDQIFEDDIGINPDKLCRMLYAYEPDDLIHLALETQDDTPVISIRGREGTLRTTRPTLDLIKRMRPLKHIQTRHPPVVSGDKDAKIFRDWLVRAEHAASDEIAISFKHDNEHERYTLWAVSEASGAGCVLDNPATLAGTNDLRTLISLDLLTTALAPACIDGGVKFAFGDDTPLYIGTQVNGCDVGVAIAPRIEAE